MLIGLLSDTHGQAETARRAIALLMDRGCEYLIHAGDIGDDVIELLPSNKSAFVFGNTDFDVAEMRRLAADVEVKCLGHGGVVTLAGKTIAVCHGDHSRLINGFLAAGVDYLVTGHTHVRHDHREGRTRMINPGALYRATLKSVATLDLATDKLQFVEVDDR